MRSHHCLALNSLMVFHCVWSTIHVPHHGSPHVGPYAISSLSIPLMMSLQLMPSSPLLTGLLHAGLFSLFWMLYVWQFGVSSLVIFPVWDAFLPKVIQVSAPCYLSVSPSLTTWCRHITLCHTTPFYFFQNTYHYIFAWSNYLSIWEFFILSTVTPLPESKDLIYFVHCISRNTYNGVWQ